MDGVIHIQLLKHLVVEFRSISASAKMYDEIQLFMILLKPFEKAVSIN